MGNTHDTEIARIEADLIHTRYRTTEDYRWGYSNDRGPETWWVYYPSASGGMQSPIDVNTEEVTWDPDLCYHPLQINYGVDFNPDGSSRQDDNGSVNTHSETMYLENTGNSATININNSHSFIVGGPCKSHNYVLDHIDIHWGESDDCGSEHLINTTSSAAEIHLVHWNEDLYESFEDASKREDGIFIAAVLVDISEERSNRGLRYLTGLLQDITYRGQSTSITSDLDASVFLPDKLNKYWTYQGSFTTPPCYETVTWMVFHDSVSVTSDDLAKFRNLKCYEESEMRPNDDCHGRIAKNIRIVQPMGTRKVYTAENIHNRYVASMDDSFRVPTPMPTQISTFPECVGA